MKRKNIKILLVSSMITASAVLTSKNILAIDQNDKNENLNDNINDEKKLNNKQKYDITPLEVEIKNEKDSNITLQQKNLITNSLLQINEIKVDKQLIDINYPKGVFITPKYIVIHDTDNREKGANAQANRDYFANHEEAYASAHYIVDDSNIIQALEDTWMGWHAGDRYTGISPNVPDASNSNTIAIELCVNSDNNFDKTLENGIALTKYLMEKYNIPAKRVIQHHDVSGKDCPRIMLEDNKEIWPYFKKSIGNENYLTQSNSKTVEKKGVIYNIRTALNIRSNPSMGSNIIGKLSNGTSIDIVGETNGWYKIKYNGKDGYVSDKYIRVQNNDEIKYKGKVQVSSALNVRKGPGTSYSIISSLLNNQIVKIIEDVGEWYKIEVDGKEGYVLKQYIKKVDNIENNEEVIKYKKGNVTKVSTNLNVRKVPSFKGQVISYLLPNTEVIILEENNGWYKVKFDSNIGEREGYVFGKYIKVS